MRVGVSGGGAAAMPLPAAALQRCSRNGRETRRPPLGDAARWEGGGDVSARARMWAWRLTGAEGKKKGVESHRRPPLLLFFPLDARRQRSLLRATKTTSIQDVPLTSTFMGCTRRPG